MLRRVQLFVLCVVLACLSERSRNLPSVHTNLQHHNPIRIQIDHHFSDYEHRQFIAVLPSLSGLNLRYIEVVDHPDLYVQKWINPRPEDMSLGLYFSNTNFILIDSGRIFTELQLRAAILHETGHWLGMRHVCLDQENNLPKYGCSPVGYGPGIMNPLLTFDHVQEFTTLDILEYQRVSRMRL